MPFHFKKSETSAKAIRRLCRERLRAARKCLRRGDRPGSVHGARKEIKKLRAALRLVRAGIGRDDYRKVAKTLRRAADCLAASRDAWVTLKAFEKLAGASGSRFAAVKKALRKHCQREDKRFWKNDAVKKSGRRLRKTARRVDALKIPAAGWAAIEPGLRQSYQSGREAFALVRREPSPEHLHAWRKHVKNLWYQLRLLCPSWPAPARALMKQAELLGEMLGDDHDLTLLKQFAAGLRAEEAGEVGALNRLIEARQKKLRAAVLKLGTLVYSEMPAAFCRRLGRHWNAWRNSA